MKLSRISKEKPKKKPKSQVSGSDFTEMKKVKSKSQELISKTTLSSPLLHRSCNTLMYGTFLRIKCGAPLTLLAISGEPSLEELELAWNDILEEYSTLIKSPKAESIFELYKRIVKTQWTMLYLDETLPTLLEQYDEIDALRIAELGYSLILPLNDRLEYIKQIEFVGIESRSLIVMLNQYVAEFERLAPQEQLENVPERTMMDYEKELAALSKYQGHRINKKRITVFEFTAIVNNVLSEQKVKAKNG